MAKTEFFKFDGGMTSIKEKEAGEGYSDIRLRTEIPAVPVKVRGTARCDQQGVVSFSMQALGNKGAVQYLGKRDVHGLQIQFQGMGYHGQIFFEASSYDLTSLDLMLLDEEADVKDIPDGKRLRIVDIFDLQIDGGRVKNVVADEGGKQIRRFVLDFKEGIDFELCFDCKTGKIVQGRDVDVKWTPIARDEVDAHLETLRKATPAA